MTREEHIKQLISQQGYTVKEFAAHINIPYSTLRSMLNGSLGGSSVDNVIKVYKGLAISMSEGNFENMLGVSPDSSNGIDLSEHEKLLIESYRTHTELQAPIDLLLGVSANTLKKD